MSMVIFIAKVCVMVFFGTVFVWNMIDLMRQSRVNVPSDLYFEKQMWMLISLSAIAIVLSNL